jgi:recombinational DNA repair protein (RecF pathway)
MALMPNDPTAADRQRRWRERQQAGTPWQPPVCAACGRNTSGGNTSKPTYGELCRRCWEKLTPEGRAAKAERVRQSRARRRAV